MRADNTSHLRTATRRRVEATRRRAIAALRRLDNAGAHITFGTVAREARVSRSWLYTQPELRSQIERLRTRHPSPAAARLAPDRQRASDTSLLRRLEAATARIRHLETENKELRQALEHALGQRRAAQITSQRARSG
jgi:hypothetical protein